MDTHAESNDERERESYNLFNIESSCDREELPAYAQFPSLPAALATLYCLWDNRNKTSYRGSRIPSHYTEITD